MALEGLMQLPAMAANTVKWAWNNNPAARAGRVAGAASTYTPGQKGEGMRVLKQMHEESKLQSLNPMQENVIKTVQKVQSENVKQAMAQGASGEQVLKDAGISFATEQPTPETNEDGSPTGEAVKLSLAGQQPPELAGKASPTYNLQTPENLLQALFQQRSVTTDKQGNVTAKSPGMFNITPSPNKEILALASMQELAGQKPLQKGAAMKMGLQGAIDIQKELAKGGSVDALTPENAGKFQLLSEGFEATGRIDQLLGDNVTAAMWAQGVPTFLKSQQGRLLESAIEVAVQDRTRIETGAALQPSELESTKKRFMPKKGDSINTALTRLKPLYDYFGGAMNIADPTGTHRQRAKEMNAQQVSAKITSFKEIK